MGKRSVNPIKFIKTNEATHGVRTGKLTQGSRKHIWGKDIGTATAYNV